jgi:dTDP-4-dehydrorhamnose reductase
MNILGLGFEGHLGDGFVEFCPKDIKLISTGKTQIDITKVDEIYNAINKYNPFCVINCAAITNENDSEIKTKNVYEVNFLGALNVVRACKAIKTKLVHIDSCFSVCPTNEYAYSKFAAAEVIKKMAPDTYIARIGWLFGGRKSQQFDFLLKNSKRPLGISTGNYGSPTYIKDSVDAIYDGIKSGKVGLEDIANKGRCNRWEFCQALCEAWNIDNIHYPVNEFIELAKRPEDCSLNGTLRDWKEAVKYYAQRG